MLTVERVSNGYEVRMKGPPTSSRLRARHQWWAYHTNYQGVIALVGHYYFAPDHAREFALALLDGEATCCPACLEVYEKNRMARRNP